MQLDRYTRGQGKYALINNRKLDALEGANKHDAVSAISILEKLGLLDAGDSQDTEFFVIKLRDLYSRPALREYATAARDDGNLAYADEIDQMADRSGLAHPHYKRPD
jgi:hypothetical protein